MAKMYWNVLLILSMVLFTKQVSHIDNDESKDCFGCLEPDNVKCKSSATQEQVTNFIKEENCWYQSFMDKMQELDCMLDKKLKEESLPNDEHQTKLWAQMMDIREKVYDKNIITDDKICNKCETYTTFDEYTICWQTYWSDMKDKLQTEITKLKDAKSENVFENCANYGTIHQIHCPVA